MAALNWHAQIEAPRLVRESDLVYVTLGGKTVMFPSEAAARFFFEAFTELPALEAEVAILRTEIDEGALHAAKRQATELEARVAKLEREKADLEARLLTESERRAQAARRATVLANTLRRIRETL